MIAAAEDRDLVGPYRVLKAIGAGGSARIDLARIDRAYNFQRHVVLKRPLEHLRGDPRAAASLQREARLGGRLHHPNLVAVLDAGTHAGHDYLVLEYVHGASLRDAMQTETPGRVADLPLGVALAIAIDTARGLHAAHELADEHGAPLGLVHRDVAPGNVLLGLDGTVKLADFGIAKETRVSTLSGSLHGTVTYMAPEQCRGHAFDRRADVFSLGVILYELVTGTRLFLADNDVASLHRVLSGQVPRPRAVRPTLAPALEDIVMSALAADPVHRTPTARALADALERFAAEHGERVGARWIAHWMHDLLGPRDVPWSGATTQVELAVRAEGSLVELIVAAPDDLPRATTFGPTSDALAEEPARAPAPSDPPPRRALPRRALVIGLGLAGVIAGVLAVRHVDEPAHVPLPVPAAPMPPPAARATPAPIAPTTPSPPASISAPSSAPPSAPPGRRRRTRGKAHDIASPPTRVEPAAPAPPPTGTPTPPKQVEWDPTILLPTDRSGRAR